MASHISTGKSPGVSKGASGTAEHISLLKYYRINTVLVQGREGELFAGQLQLHRRPPSSHSAYTPQETTLRPALHFAASGLYSL